MKTNHTETDPEGEEINKVPSGKEKNLTAEGKLVRDKPEQGMPQPGKTGIFEVSTKQV